MSKQIINIGSAPNDGTGDALRTAFGKFNTALDEMYDTFGNTTHFTATVNGLTAVSEDTSPDLGGNLSLSGHEVYGTGNINIAGSITATGNATISGSSSIVRVLYANTSVLPNANTYSGAIAVANTQANVYFAHNGSWNRVLNASEYSAADVLAKIITVDGTGSGLDADLLDGQTGTYYSNVTDRLGYTPVNRAGDGMTGVIRLSGVSEIPTTVSSTGNVTCNVAQSGFYIVGINATTTFTFTGWDSSNVSSFSLLTKNDSTAGRTVTFPANVRWTAGVTPTRTSNSSAKDLWYFFSDDGGLNIYGSLSAADLR